jgi:hypothetical protein
MNKLITIVAFLSLALTVSAQSVRLAWDHTDLTTNTVAYNVYRALGAGSFTKENSVQLNQKSFTNTVAVNSIYNYRVTAFYPINNLENGPSLVLSVNTYPTVAPVTGWQALSATSVSLSWPAVVTHENGGIVNSPVFYLIKTNGVQALKTSSLSAVLTNLPVSTAIEVRSYAIASIPSAPNSFTVNLNVPAQVTGLRVDE